MGKDNNLRIHWCSVIKERRDFIDCKHCGGLSCRFRRCRDYCNCRTKKKHDENASIWEDLEKLDE